MVNSILQEDEGTIIHVEGDNSRGVMRRALQVRYGYGDIDNTVIVVCDEAGNLMDFKLSPHNASLLRQALDVHNAAPETGRKCGASEDRDVLNEVRSDMLTWFQAGLIIRFNPYLLTYDGHWMPDPLQHFLDCTGAETEQDYTDFKAGAEAYRECLT